MLDVMGDPPVCLVLSLGSPSFVCLYFIVLLCVPWVIRRRIEMIACPTPANKKVFAYRPISPDPSIPALTALVRSGSTAVLSNSHGSAEG